MITRQQLVDMLLITTNGWEWYDFDSDFLYNSKTKELFSHNEVDGELDFICKIKNQDQFKEVVYLNFGTEL